jgi:hypothetical protein
VENNISDIIEIKGEIGRIKNHLDLIKKSNEKQSESLTKIENTLIGNNLNGNKGIVFLLNDIDDRVKHLEKSNLEREQTETNLKWFGGFVITAFLSLMVWIITHLNPNV